MLVSTSTEPSKFIYIQEYHVVELKEIYVIIYCYVILDKSDRKSATQKREFAEEQKEKVCKKVKLSYLEKEPLMKETLGNKASSYNSNRKEFERSI